MSRGILKEKEKRKEKKERRKRLILLKNIYSRAKLVKLKVPVIIQDPDSSRIGAIVGNYTVREENKGQMVAFT